ncbi:MAG: DUF29 domain-containing protein [bacterium]
MINANIKTKDDDIKHNNLSELYTKDYYTWTMTNAELLKKGKFDELDYINLGEEVKDLGTSEYYRLESYIANLLSHLYKWDNQPDLRSKSWILTIKNSVIQIKKTVKKNPGLKSQIDDAFDDAWNGAIDILSKDVKDDNIINLIPKKPPYSFREAVKIAHKIAPEWIEEEDIIFLENLS